MGDNGGEKEKETSLGRVLKEMDIRMISLVRSGANRKQIVYKNETLDERFFVAFTKSGEEGVVYGIVYAPDETDTQGDEANAAEIKKAAYGFMRSASLAKAVDVEHSLEPVDAYVCESWIVKSGDPLFSEEGAWAVGIRLEDEALRDAVKKGEIGGLSMYGSALAETKKSLSDEILDGIRAFFKKEGITPETTNQPTKEKEDDMNEEEVKALIKSAVEEATAPLAAKLDEAVKKSEELETELSKSRQQHTPVEKTDTKTTGGIL